MALVVLLRGINVGGHRRFRPKLLAEQLEHLRAVNVGATGTLVVRAPIGRRALRAEIARRLPFTAEIVICNGGEIERLIARNRFAEAASDPGIVRFVSVLARRPRFVPPLPVSLPSTDEWLVRLLALEDRFVIGVYRRQMKVIGYLASIDKRFGVPATTRSWSTLEAVARVLAGDQHSGP